jgi:hypothetical protein
MTPWQTLRRAILPQAARVALPLSNSFISLVKDTSLAATIQVPELFRQAAHYLAYAEVFTMYLAASLIYWVMATVLSACKTTENQLNRQERDPNECYRRQKPGEKFHGQTVLHGIDLVEQGSGGDYRTEWFRERRRCCAALTCLNSRKVEPSVSVI